MKHKEFYDLADEMEKECGDWENSEGMSKQALSELMAKVEQMDKEASENTARSEVASKPGAKVTRFRLKKRYIVVLAAALVLLMGTGVVGDRAWIADSNDLERVTEVTTKVNNEEKDSILLEEEAVYQEIAEKLGIAPMRLGHLLKGMMLDSYVITENTGWAYINYLYNDKVITIQMTRHSDEFSSNVQWDGESRKLEDVVNDYGYAEDIEAYCVDAEHQNYAASITYGNGYYNIFGSFANESEFLEILRGIYFKTM